MIRDRNIEWLMKRIYIPVNQFSCFLTPAHTHDLLITGGQAAGDALQVLSAVVGKTAASDVTATGGTQNILSTTQSIQAVGTAGSILEQVSTLPLVGARLTQAGAEQVRHYLMLPYDINNLVNVYFYLFFTKPDVVSAFTPRLRYGLFNSGSALADVSTALSSPFSEISNNTDYTIIRAGPGVLAGNIITLNNLYVGLRVDITAQTGAGNIYLLGLEMVYSPRKTAGINTNVREAESLPAGNFF